MTIPNDGTLVTVILVTTYDLPCGHQFTRRGNDVSPLMIKPEGVWCPVCGESCGFSRVRMTNQLEQIDE